MIELHLRSNDANALLRVVDPDTVYNDAPENDIRIVADDTVEPAHVVVVGDSSLAGPHEIRTLDPVTYAIISLSHNAADDFESLRALATPGVFDGDIGEAARAQYDQFIGLPREQILSLAFGFGQQVAMRELIKEMGLDDHVHPNTLDEHGGEG